MAEFDRAEFDAAHEELLGVLMNALADGAEYVDIPLALAERLRDACGAAATEIRRLIAEDQARGAWEDS